MTPYLPEAWLADLKDRGSWITDPDGWASALSARAMEMHGRCEIASANLADMLEMVEAGRWWALSEIEEAFDLGIFIEGVPRDIA